MRRRIYLIAALAVVNIVVMKYNDRKKERELNTLTASQDRLQTDSLFSNNSSK